LSDVFNKTMLRGTSPTPGIARMNWMVGWNAESSLRLRPSRTPSAIPMTTARKYPANKRNRLGTTSDPTCANSHVSRNASRIVARGGT